MQLEARQQAAAADATAASLQVLLPSNTPLCSVIVSFYTAVLDVHNLFELCQSCSELSDRLHCISQLKRPNMQILAGFSVAGSA